MKRILIVGLVIVACLVVLAPLFSSSLNGRKPTAGAQELLTGICKSAETTASDNPTVPGSVYFVYGLGTLDPNASCSSAQDRHVENGQPVPLGLMLPSPGTLRNLRVMGLNSALGGVTVAVYLGSPAVRTTITCTMSQVGSYSSCSDTAHTVAVQAGDIVSVAVIPVSEGGTEGGGALQVALEK